MYLPVWYFSRNRVSFEKTKLKGTIKRNKNRLKAIRHWHVQTKIIKYRVYTVLLQAYRRLQDNVRYIFHLSLRHSLCLFHIFRSFYFWNGMFMAGNLTLNILQLIVWMCKVFKWNKIQTEFNWCLKMYSILPKSEKSSSKESNITHTNIEHILVILYI